MRVAKWFAESRGSTVKTRRNSHYGESPIAYPLDRTLLFSGNGGIKVAYFLCARKRAHFLIGGNL